MSNSLEVKLVDSFVLNKIGEGHGESTLYLGGKTKHNLILKIFTNFDAEYKFAFKKDNLMKTLVFFKNFYKRPHDFYLNTGEKISFSQNLSQVYKGAMDFFNELNDRYQENAFLISPDSQGRVYLRFSPDSILRRFFLPHSVSCKLLRIDSGDIFCELYPVIMSTKKTIKINNKKYWTEFNYFK